MIIGRSKKYSRDLFDDSRKDIRGKMRYKKACATYPNSMKMIRKKLRQKFPALRQAKKDWLVHRILRNVLHNSMPRTRATKLVPQTSSDVSLDDTEVERDFSTETSPTMQRTPEGVKEEEIHYEEENWLGENDALD